jgi:hypothetical protein
LRAAVATAAESIGDSDFYANNTTPVDPSVATAAESIGDSDTVKLTGHP